MTDLFEMADALEARRAGMQIAADNADSHVIGWTDRAFEFLKGYAKTHQSFISEDVSDASKECGFPQPPTDRAWGSVYRRALKEDIIIQVGSGRSRRRHASICPRWGSLICKARATA